MKYKQLVHASILSLLTLAIVGLPIGRVLKVAAVGGGAGNDKGYAAAVTDDCLSCEHHIPGNDRGSLDNNTGTCLSATVEIDGKTYTHSEIITPNENKNFPSSLKANPNGVVTTNLNYKTTVDGYLNSETEGVIVNGKYNEDNEAVKILIKAAEKSGQCSGTNCLTLLEGQIKKGADKNGNATDDYMDLTYETMMMVCPESGCVNKYWITTKEATKLSGIEYVANAANKAVQAGTDTKYSTTKKGDYGTGTYDACDKINKTECVGSCGCGDHCDWNPNPYKPNWKYEPGKPPGDPELPEIKKDELPGNKQSGGNCGEDFSQTTYVQGDAIDSCGLSHYIIETKTTVNVPTNAGSIFAGQPLNWGGITSTSTVNVYPDGGVELQTTFIKNEVEKQEIQNWLDFYQGELEKAQQALSDLEDAWQACEDAQVSCPSYYEWECGGYEDEPCASDPSQTCSTYVSETCNNSDEISACETSNAENYANCTADLMAIDDMQEIVDNAQEQYDQYKAQNEEHFQELNERSVELNKCIGEYQGILADKPIDTQNSIGVANVSSSSLTINGETQYSGDFSAVNKGSGSGSSDVNDNSIPLTEGSNFYIPPSTADGTVGILNETIELPNGTSFTLSCKVDIMNTAFCDDCGEGSSSSGRGNLNLIYRPISLTNPFPMNRKAISSWQDSMVVESIITNNRGVNDYEVYNLKPMYDITLTPSTIKEIRKYNKQHSYNDFTLKCTKGLYCRSSFLRDNSYIYNNINLNNSCGMSSDWYACDTDKIVSDVKENLFGYLK